MRDSPPPSLEKLSLCGHFSILSLPSFYKEITYLYIALNTHWKDRKIAISLLVSLKPWLIAIYFLYESFMQQVLGLGLGNKLDNYSLFHKALYQSKSGFLELFIEHGIKGL